MTKETLAIGNADGSDLDNLGDSAHSTGAQKWAFK